MSKRSFSESIDSEVDMEQEALIVEEIERWKNRLKVLRKGRKEGGTSAMIDQRVTEDSSVLDWFESKDNTFFDTGNDNEGR